MNLDDDKATRLMKMIFREGATADRVSAMDNRELLWWILQMDAFREQPLDFSFEESLRGELENRLYPEYDGDKVQMTDYGWTTPDGPLIYVKTDAP